MLMGVDYTFIKTESLEDDDGVCCGLMLISIPLNHHTLDRTGQHTIQSINDRILARENNELNLRLAESARRNHFLPATYPRLFE